MKKLALVLISAAYSFSPALAQQKQAATPFDFVWGESIEDVTARYGQLEPVAPSEYRPDLESFLIGDWPDESFLPGAVSVRVDFLREGGLENLQIRTANFDDDDLGTEARRLFSALVDELTGTWGEFSGSREVLPQGGPYAAPDQFYQCTLAGRFYGSCGTLWAYHYPADCIGTAVVATFVPEQRRVGYFTVKYVDPSATDCR